MKITKRIIIAVAMTFTAGTSFSQGSLIPPGAPGTTMKTLDQIDAAVEDIGNQVDVMDNKLNQIDATGLGVSNRVDVVNDKLEQVESRIPISSLPITISQSGSYYLTTNLTLTVAGQNGITVNANDVAIDLNGFTMTGPGANSGHGIYQLSSWRSLRVHNGKLVGWGGATKGGVYIYGSNNLVDHMQVSTSYYGFRTSYSCVISDCSASDSTTYGFHIGSGSTVSDCTAFSNTGTGIRVELGCTMSGCTARFNGIDGFYASTGSRVVDCVACYNSGYGIVGNASTISGCTSYANVGDGIRVYNHSVVIDNTCNSNGNGGDASGILVTGFHCRIDGNTLISNDRGLDVDYEGNMITRNTAMGNGTNYEIMGTQTIGPIITDTGTIETTNPWANFSF